VGARRRNPLMREHLLAIYLDNYDHRAEDDDKTKAGNRGNRSIEDGQAGEAAEGAPDEKLTDRDDGSKLRQCPHAAAPFGAQSWPAAFLRSAAAPAAAATSATGSCASSPAASSSSSMPAIVFKPYYDVEAVLEHRRRLAGLPALAAHGRGPCLDASSASSAAVWPLQRPGSVAGRGSGASAANGWRPGGGNDSHAQQPSGDSTPDTVVVAGGPAAPQCSHPTPMWPCPTRMSASPNCRKIVVGDSLGNLRVYSVNGDDDSGGASDEGEKEAPGPAHSRAR
jgi:hypothetical protein